MVVAKVSQEEEAATSYGAMRALWDSPLSRSEHVSIARPLAFVPELGLLVQSAVPEERNLKELLHAALLSGTSEDLAELDGTLQMTARGLADLHRCGATHGEVVTWLDELASLRKKRAKLADVMPRLADLEDVLDRLEAAALTAPPDPFVPVHHSFRPAQVLLADGGIAFIDFDKSCQSEPASDLAMFTTKLRHASLNKLHVGADDEDDDELLDDATRLERIRRADSLCETFVGEYGRHASVSPRRIALWEALELFSLILSAAKKVNAGRVENCAFMLDQHMRRHGL
jgi:aminoglycoside phosphotransferase (APT) family kinase protein